VFEELPPLPCYRRPDGTIARTLIPIEDYMPLDHPSLGGYVPIFPESNPEYKDEDMTLSMFVQTPELWLLWLASFEMMDIL